MAVAISALFVALGGVSAAATGLLDGAGIKAGTIGHRQLGRHSVSGSNLVKNSIGITNLNGALRRQINSRAKVTLPGQSGGPGSKGGSGANGAQGPQGPQGGKGNPGADLAIPVINVPAITSGSTNGTDSGASGDGGFYYAGNGPGGSAKIANGALVLNGAGTDTNTAQGGIGIAHAYPSVPLSQLSALVYSWFNTVDAGTQAPVIHITVTGATLDSKFGSGFANIVYLPAQSDGLTTPPVMGSVFTQDTFGAGAQWYSTGAGCNQVASGCTPVSDTGGQNNPKPLSYFVSNDPSAVIAQISLDNGGSSGTPAGTYQGEADNLLLGFNGTNTRYDFGG